MFYLRYYNMLKKMNKGLLGLALSMGLTSVQAAETKHVDVLLIGGGIMSTTLGVWLNELEPNTSMQMIERYGPEFDPRTGLGGCEVWLPVTSVS